MSNDTEKQRFYADLFSEETGETSDCMIATDIDEAISFWVANGYEVISVTDEDGNEYSV